MPLDVTWLKMTHHHLCNNRTGNVYSESNNEESKTNQNWGMVCEINVLDSKDISGVKAHT